MPASPATQGAVLLSAFLVPLLTYLYFSKPSQTAKQTPDSAKGAPPGKEEKDAGPLPPPTKITQLLIHPIKSCHGISVQKAKVLDTGLDLDRQWMWVNSPKHDFLTIRQNPRMTLIRPSYDADSDTLIITAPGSTPSDSNIEIRIPAHPHPDWLKSNTTEESVTIWEQKVQANMYLPSLTAQFDTFFNEPVRLVYKSPISTAPRVLRANGAPKLLGRVASTCFPDLHPVLVGSESSIAELNSRLEAKGESPITVRRFRPNVIVAGDKDAPWDEDRWKTVKISAKASDLTLDITQRCARCRVPNVDIDTAEEHKKQPWDTLVGYRRIDEGHKYKPCYGMLGVPRKGGVEIEVGMQLDVTEVTAGHKIIAGF